MFIELCVEEGENRLVNLYAAQEIGSFYDINEKEDFYSEGIIVTWSHNIDDRTIYYGVTYEEIKDKLCVK